MKSGFLAVLAVALGFFTIAAGSANAAQRIDLSVTDAWYMESEAPDDPTVPSTSLLALDPGGDPMKLSGVLDQAGNFTIPADQFEVTPINYGIQIYGLTMSYRAVSDISGTYSAKTGKLTMSAPLEYLIRYRVPTDPDIPPARPEPLDCAFGGIDSTLQTSGSVLTTNGTFAGKPFAKGSVQLLGGWSTPYSTLLNNARGIDGSLTTDCLSGAFGEDIDGKSLTGKLWLRADVALTDIPSVKMEFKTKAAKVKAGKTTSLKLRVQNLTDSRTSVKVDLKSSNPNVKVKKSIKVSVPASSVYLTDIKVNASRKAKGKAKITATAEGRKTVATVAVTPAG